MVDKVALEPDLPPPSAWGFGLIVPSSKWTETDVENGTLSNLKRALAGRSAAKVEKVASEIKQLNPDRTEPAILAVQLNREELDPLVQRTKVVINCVGPYHLYSMPGVEACAVNGTHYVDVETLRIKTIIKKYHDTARSNNAIMIVSAGVESAPGDILTWSVVKRIREDLSSNTRELNSCFYKLRASGASGGTANTLLTSFATLPLSKIAEAINPFTLAGSTPKDIPKPSLLRKLLGVRHVRDLGALTTPPTGMADITIVHRSSTLMPELYGPRFYYRQLLRVPNVILGILAHVALILGPSLVVLPFVRSLLRTIVHPPGSGPRIDDMIDDQVEYRAIAKSEQTSKRVFGKLRYTGSMYAFLGAYLAEEALVILQNEAKVKVSRCGIVTPATLGQEYVDRLHQVGCTMETQVLDS